MRKNIIKSTAVLCAITLMLSSAPATTIHAAENDNANVEVTMEDRTYDDDLQDTYQAEDKEEAEEANDAEAEDENVEMSDDQTTDENDIADDDNSIDDAENEDDIYCEDENDQSVSRDPKNDVINEDTQQQEENNEETPAPEQPVVPEEIAAITTLTAQNTAITLSKTSSVFNEKAQTPAVTVRCGDTGLVKDVDFTVSYANNVNAGKATVTIQGIGNYDGTVTKNYTIAKAGQKFSAKANMKEVELKKKARISYTGAKGKVTYASSNNKIAVVNSKGIVTAKKPGNVTITAKSGATANFKEAASRIKIKVIGTKLSAGKAKVKLSRNSYTYNGKAKRPAIKISFKGKALKKGRDFKASYRNNKNAGKATIVIKGLGNYSGSFNKAFTINKADNHMKANIPSTMFDINDNTQVNVNNADGNVTYRSSNSKVAQVNNKGKITGKGKGECTIFVTAAGDNNHKKSVKKFKVLVGSRELNGKACEVNLPTSRFVFDGTSKKPIVNVKCNGKKLVQDKDYTVSYDENVNAGTGRIILTGKGLYKGTRVVNLQIEKAEQADFTVDVLNNRIPLNGTAKVNVKGGIGTISFGSYSPSYAKHIGGGVFKGLRKTQNYVTITVTAAGDNNHKAKTIEKRVSIN